MADNKVSKVITYRPILKGPEVKGVFQGRPLYPLARQWQLPIDNDCEKVKTELILYWDSTNMEPTTYTISFVGAGDIVHESGSTYRWKKITGKWFIMKGIVSNLDRVIYRLETSRSPSYFYLLKGDNNVLFILDDKKQPIIGDGDFCYTLNRVELVAYLK
ncbi:MAG: hypothetical protein NVS9B7_19760 [Flavisolibacter sp.]